MHRIVFLVGDAPPHMDYAQDTKYPQTLKVAKQKDILVNAVLAGGARDTERVWREVAQLGGGRFIPIPQDGGEVVIIETPYDEEIIILQQKIGRTVLPYGPAPMQRRAEDKVRQVTSVAAAAPSSASDMASFINKRAKVSGEAVTGDGDLVSDVKSGRKALEAIAESESAGGPAQAARAAAAGEDRCADVGTQGAERDSSARWSPSATPSWPTSARLRPNQRARSTPRSKRR